MATMRKTWRPQQSHKAENWAAAPRVVHREGVGPGAEEGPAPRLKFWGETWCSARNSSGLPKLSELDGTGIIHKATLGRLCDGSGVLRASVGRLCGNCTQPWGSKHWGSAPIWHTLSHNGPCIPRPCSSGTGFWESVAHKHPVLVQPWESLGPSVPIWG